MALINYLDIDFNKSIDNENKIIDFNGSQIEVVPYLSAQDRYDLVMITLQQALENGTYNELKLDMYFYYNVVVMFTNIVMPEDIDELEAFDVFNKSGLTAAVLATLDTGIVDYLHNKVFEIKDNLMKYRNTFGSVFSTFVNQLPEKMQQVSTMLEDLDQEKIRGILELAQSE